MIEVRELNEQRAVPETSIAKSLVLVTAFSLLIAAALIFRLTMGVCLFDEGFYLELARSIMAWERPFVGQASIAQTSSVMLIPFIQLWHLLGFGDQGIVLWMRIVYYLSNICCSVVLFFYAKKRLDSTHALLVSLLGLVWMPFGIPALSYYTLGTNSFLCGLLCYSLSGDERINGWIARVADVLLAIACLAYPPLTVPCLAFLVWRSLNARNQVARKSRIVSIITLVCIGIASVLLLIALCGIQHLWNSLMVVHALAGFYKSDMLQVTRWIFGEPYYPTLISATALAALGVAFAPSLRVRLFSTISFTGVLLATLFLKPGLMSTMSHIEVLLLFLFFVPAALRDPHFSSESRLIFWISGLAGLLFTFSSGSGPVTFCLGAYPAVCVAMMEFMERQKRSESRMLISGAAALCAVSVTVLCFYAATTIYGDKELDWSQAVRVQSGPFCWLKTSPSRRFLVTQLQQDLADYGKSCNTIYIVGPPGLYLCSNLKPLDLLLWHCWQPQRFDLVASHVNELYAEFGHPDLIVITTDTLFGVPNKLDSAMLQKYTLALNRPEYRIFLTNDKMASVNEKAVVPLSVGAE